jgi:hypothetical protein
MHNGHEDRTRRNRSPKIIRVNQPHSVNGQVCDTSTQALDEPARFDDGGMLDAGGDDMIPFLAKSKEGAFHSKIVGLAAAARENDLVTVAIKKRCDLLTSCVQGHLCRRCGPMAA